MKKKIIYLLLVIKSNKEWEKLNDAFVWMYISQTYIMISNQHLIFCYNTQAHSCNLELKQIIGFKSQYGLNKQSHSRLCLLCLLAFIIQFHSAGYLPSAHASASMLLELIGAFLLKLINNIPPSEFHRGCYIEC